MYRNEYNGVSYSREFTIFREREEKNKKSQKNRAEWSRGKRSDLEHLGLESSFKGVLAYQEEGGKQWGIRSRSKHQELRSLRGLEELETLKKLQVIFYDQCEKNVV